MTRSPAAILHVLRADYLDRVRTHAFLVTLAFTAWFAYVSLPPNHAPYATLQIDGRRGLYNSAWVGAVTSLMTSAFLSLVGFYLVKNSIERDRRTGVGPILASTALTRWEYVVGKWASNLAVLATMVAGVAVCAIGAQLLRGEDRAIDLLRLLSPFAVVTLPAMAVTAGMAVAFEAVPALRGGFGNVVYFFAWGTLLSGAALPQLGEQGLGDAMGSSAVLPAMQRAAVEAFPGVKVTTDRFSMGFNFHASGHWDLTMFRWGGAEWTAGALARRLAWVVIGLGIGVAATFPFDRFDTTREPGHWRGMGRRAFGWRGRRERPPDAPGTDAAGTDGADDGEGDVEAIAGPILAGRAEAGGAGTAGRAALADPHGASTSRAPVPAREALPPLAAGTRRFRFAALLRAELRLLARSMPRLWWVVAAGLTVASALAPLGVARAWLLPFAWIWPLVAWSRMGARDALNRTTDLIHSSARPLARQLPATFVAGALVALALGAGVLIRSAAAGDVATVASCLIGAAFISSLALACGAWTGSAKLFEVAYLLVWYVGPMQHTGPLDFLGPSAAVRMGFAVAAVVLLALAVQGRRRVMNR